ncbi:RidA family protein [Desulfotalea psychrophila]|uniref:Translation initiation inhibitor n=1 Tax=Desulfotalea psychrophila (strain LSv54 / DSM 12343) TaxID=177439 RepID=Q6AM18_DESPS|nr:RidA family protein [Desulfotalea psychrophila]CAG36607.1 conserved hypothetical protein [Desulfotalea psychrophila LSv54]
MAVQQRKVISTKDAPNALGPYSQAVKTDSMVFVSGQLGLDPVTGEIVAGDVQTETRQVMTNLGAILSAAGSNFELVVKATVFVANLTDFAKINAVYAEFFGEEAPARACVEVAHLPKNARVEIDLIALV